VINQALALQESACTSAEMTAPWYPTLLGYEHHDSSRSKMYPCAQFTGMRSGNNSVFAFKSPENFYTPSMMATRGTNEMYVYGGSSAATPLPTGPYVSKVEPGSLKELWRTSLLNTFITNQWSGAGSIESFGGDVLAILNTYLFKIDGTTGAIKGMLSLPTIGTNPNDSYFNGLDGWSDGTLVMKNLNRAPGCTIPGWVALAACPNLQDTPSSTIVVVDPGNLTVLDSKQMEQMVGGRITAAELNGKKYAYAAGSSLLYRYVWDGSHITLDSSWGPVSYLQPGQTAASAVSIMGDWVVLMTNGGAPTQTPLSVVAVSQTDATKLIHIEPMPLQPGQTSYIPSRQATDIDNGRIYAMDPGAGKTVGIDIDLKTGALKVAWSADQATLSWLILIGPPDQRVLVGTNIQTDTPIPNPIQWNPGPEGANYSEQVQWRDASTGNLLAASDYWTPMTPGMQVWPGYGGLIYFGENDGGLIALQVLPSSTSQGDRQPDQGPVDRRARAIGP
jgi:hypothetical protein